MITRKYKQMAQQAYCAANDKPNFAGDGDCSKCGRNVYDQLSLLKCKTELITRCTCGKSFL